MTRRILWAVKGAIKERVPPPLWTRARSTYHRQRRLIRKTRWGIENVRNFIVDLQFGGYCSGAIPTRFAHLDAYGCSHANYNYLAKMFDPRQGVAIGDQDVLVDVGCGKGRVVNFWLKRAPGNKIVALELDPAIAAQTGTRLSRYRNVHVITGDAVQNLPADGSLFYLFNPFGEVLVETFKTRFKQLYTGRPGARILYYHCKHVNVFERDPAFCIRTLPCDVFYRAVVITLANDRAAADSPQ